MSQRKLLTDQLLTDFSALTFSDNATPLLSNAKKFYKDSTMQGGDLLLIYDDNDIEEIGISTDERLYGYQAIYLEGMESGIDEATAITRLDRLAEVEDGLMNYLQKQPNNLRNFGNSNNIGVNNIVVRNTIFDDLQTKNGVARVMRIRFIVNITIDVRTL